MRIYGSSPLYNYVELIFRCKRMFIVSIILGTVIISSFAYSRPTQYDASMLVALTGKPDVVETSAAEARESDYAKNPAFRKASRLSVLLQSYPEFLTEVVKNAQLDMKHPGKSVDELAGAIRKSVPEPHLINGQYMEVKITWPRADEAEEILRQIYSRFADRVVHEETQTATVRKQIAEKQYNESEKRFEIAAKSRVDYQKDHYFQNASLIGAELTKSDNDRASLDSTTLDLNEAKQRLAEVNKQLPGVPKTIETVNSTNTNNVMDPTIADAAEIQQLKQELDQKSGVYSSQHPVIQGLQRRIADAQARLEKDKEHPVKPKMQPTQRDVHTERNPEYAELKTAERDLVRTVSALSRRQQDLSAALATSQTRVSQMPEKEIAWQRIEQEFNLASNIRNNRRAIYENRKLEEELDVDTESRLIKQEVAPKAEKIETSAKAILLYALGPLLGIVIAFCFSLVAESLDHTLRTPVEVEKYLGKPVLAVIPKVQAGHDRKRLAGSSHTSIGS